MLRLKKTKLFKGTVVSIRSYELDQAKRMGGLILEYGGETMTFYTPQLFELKPTGNLIQSKTGGQNYWLIDIEWKPNNLDHNQGDLFNE